jgi:alpha-galactosidase
MVGWWYHTDLSTKQRWFGHLGGFDSEIGWQQYLEAMSENVSRVESLALDESRPVTETIKPVQSDEQIVPIVNALVNDIPGLYQVNIPNRGPLLPGFPEDLVVECQGVVSGAGIRGVAVPPLPPRLMAGAMLPRWKDAEIFLQALQTGERELLLLDLLEDHRTRNLANAEALIDEWLVDPRNERIARLFKA